MFKVVVSAGHGGSNSTPGKRTPDGEYEWNFNNKVVVAFIAELSKYENVEVLRVDDASGKTDVPLKTRTDKANAFGADLYVSFHHNAYLGVWGSHTGSETFTYLGSNPKSEEASALIHKAIVRAYGLYNRGEKEANFHELRETNMAAVLVEGGYMDSTIDIKKLRDNNVLKNAGILAAQAVAQYGSLKLKEAVTSQDTIHVVESGDTLWSISRTYGAKVDDIKLWNNLKSDTIYVGQKLIVKKPESSVQGDKVVTVSSSNSKPKPKPKAEPKAKFSMPNGVVRYGDKGADVTKLQKALNAAKFKLKGKVDGSFGPDTLQALKRFQSVYTPYEVDGIYGPKTKAALNKVVN